MRNQRISTVFVVDDETMIAETLGLVLRSEGYKCTCFFNPLEALSAAESGAPDLLISDVMMPELSGVKLAIRFRRRWPDCRIFLFSGNAGTANLLQEAHLEGFTFSLVGKPIHPKELIELINRMG